MSTTSWNPYGSCYGTWPEYGLSFHIPEPESFTEEKVINDNERVLCKGTSTRRELKKLPNKTGYKARKEFWR